jgi:hypothetical protein
MNSKLIQSEKKKKIFDKNSTKKIYQEEELPRLKTN